SRPVAHLPLAQRRLQVPSRWHSNPDFHFSQLVQAMNAGSASRGAWRRLLVRVPGASARDLREMVTARVRPATLGKRAERLPVDQLQRIRPAHIHRAVARLLAGEDAPNFADSRDYDLVAQDGTRLAPKKVFGLAIEEALGIKAYPGHFSAGWSQPAFPMLQAAG